MTPYIPSTPSEIAAHLGRLADVVLQHRLAQALPWRATQALLAVARQDVGMDPDAASRLVRAALVACVTAEAMALREVRR